LDSLDITPAELSQSIRQVLYAEGDLAAARASDSKQLTSEVWSKLAEIGCFGLAIPAEFGGLGLGFVELGILYEEMGRFVTPLPAMSTLLAAQSVLIAGTSEQKSRWLPAIASGALRATLTLPDAAALPVMDRDNRITGGTCNVLYADRIDELFIPVRREDGELKLAIIPAASDRLTLQGRAAVDPTRSLYDVRLRGFCSTPERLIPLERRTLAALLDHASVGLASDSVGGATRVFEMTIAYLGDRKQFGRVIGSFQALKHRAATLKVLIEGVRALTRHAAELIAEADPMSSAIASCAKVSACEAYTTTAGEAIQLHGGIGFTWEHACHLFLKRATLNAALYGSLIEHRDRAATVAFADTRDPAEFLLRPDYGTPMHSPELRD
jgi:alkylation response protein AidB-like acyl-CoA dehydrogenase